MRQPKYELTEESKIVDGHTVYRIRALRDFGNIKAGQLGGWVEKEKNLIINGEPKSDPDWNNGIAWVYDEAVVMEGAHVYGAARIMGNAMVRGSADVCEDAWVYENALLDGECMVEGNARVYGNAHAGGSAWVKEDTHLFGNAEVEDFMSLLGAGKIDRPLSSHDNTKDFFKLTIDCHNCTENTSRPWPDSWKDCPNALALR